MRPLARSAVPAVALSLVPVLAGAQTGPGYQDDHMWGALAHGWFLGPLMMVFWLVVLVGAVVLVLRLLDRPGERTGPRGNGGDKALAILRERFARGEIDQAEFEERKRLLE